MVQMELDLPPLQIKWLVLLLKSMPLDVYNLYMIWIGNLIAVRDRMILSSLVMWALWMIMLNPSYPTTMEMPGIFLLHSKEVPQSLTQPLRKVIFLMFWIIFANINDIPFCF
jgi:hypothetical protein